MVRSKSSEAAVKNKLILRKKTAQYADKNNTLLQFTLAINFIFILGVQHKVQKGCIAQNICTLTHPETKSNV